MLFAYHGQITSTAHPEYVASALIDLILHRGRGGPVPNSSDMIALIKFDKRLWIALVAWRRNRDPDWPLPDMGPISPPPSAGPTLTLVKG